MAFLCKSHGKSACDGVGGTIKRLVDRAIKLDQLIYPINCPKLMFDFCCQNITNIKFFYLEIADIISHTIKFELEERYYKCSKFKGIRSHHSFKPINESSFIMKRVSSDILFSEVQLIEVTDIDINYQYLIPGVYVVCNYDSLSYIGIIKSIENSDLNIKFMRKIRDNIFAWPEKDDICWIPFQDVLTILEPPNILSTRQYKFNCKNLIYIA